MKLRKCEQKTSGQGSCVYHRNNYLNDFKRLRKKFPTASGWILSISQTAPAVGSEPDANKTPLPLREGLGEGVIDDDLQSDKSREKPEEKGNAS